MAMQKYLMLGLAGCLALSVMPMGWSASTARVAWVHNTVQITRGGRWVPAGNGTVVASGAYVRTGHNSRAQVHYADGSVMRLGSRSVARIRDARAKQVNLTQGKAYFKVQPQNQRMRVKTRNAVATVMGTEFVVEVKEGTELQQQSQLSPYQLSYASTAPLQMAQSSQWMTQITTLSGLVGVSGLTGGPIIELGPGMMTFVNDNQMPQAPQSIDTEQFQQDEDLLQEQAEPAGNFANAPLDPANPQQQFQIQQNSPGSQGQLDAPATTGSLEVIIR